MSQSRWAGVLRARPLAKSMACGQRVPGTPEWTLQVEGAPDAELEAVATQTPELVGGSTPTQGCPPPGPALPPSKPPASCRGEPAPGLRPLPIAGERRILCRAHGVQWTHRQAGLRKRDRFPVAPDLPHLSHQGHGQGPRGTWGWGFRVETSAGPLPGPAPCPLPR